MRRIIFFCALFSLGLITGCQKDLDWDINDVRNNTGGNTGGGTDTTLSEGELMVRAVQIDATTLDSSIAILDWDSNKRLREYFTETLGDTYDQRIERQSDGRISKIVSVAHYKPSGGDSAVYYPFYIPGTKQLDYVIDTFFSSLFGNLIDSISFTYNSKGQITERLLTTTIFGIKTDGGRKDYEYDGNGNLIKFDTYADRAGTAKTGSATISYSNHKAIAILGEECFILSGLISETLVSKNDFDLLKSTDATTGLTFSYDVSDAIYNEFDRQTYSYLSVTPKPPATSDYKRYYYYK